MLNNTQRRFAASGLVLASVSVLVVAAHPTTATGSTASAETLTFTSREGSFRFIDIAPKGERPTPGDSLVLVNQLWSSGERVGSLHATCVVTRKAKDPDRTPLLCHGMYLLPGGRLSGTAVVGGSDTTTIAITGGTGKYAGASGTSVEVSEGATGTVTITLE